MNFGWWQAFAQGWVYYTPATGLVTIKPAIFSYWGSLGWEQGQLGFPLANEVLSMTASSESVAEQIFQGGTIRHNYNTNTTSVDYNPGVLAPGRYRLVLTGFTVLTETTDDPLQRDGKGDEIYIRTDGFVRNDNGTVAPIPPHSTKVMGDKYGFEQTLRVRAGTRGDEGGLMTGNSVPMTQPWSYTRLQAVTNSYTSLLPVLVWEGEIGYGNYLVVIPSVWEWDENRASWLENNWNAMLEGMKNYQPRDYNMFKVGVSQQITQDKVTGTVPVGVGTYWAGPGKILVMVNTPRIVASRQGFYFGQGEYYKFSGRNQNQSLHGPDSFQADFQAATSPNGSYRLYFKWEKV
jgi:hypothetical protein